LAGLHGGQEEAISSTNDSPGSPFGGGYKLHLRTELATRYVENKWLDELQDVGSFEGGVP
jgi:hypothetical protein